MNSIKNNKALVALSVVSFFWGTTYLASRIGAQQMPGLFLAALRQFISGSILLLYFGIKRYKIPDLKTLRKIFTQGIFMLMIGNGLSTWAVQFIPSGLAAVIAALIPLLVVLFSMLLLRNASFTLKMILGLVIGFIGISAIFYEYLHDLFNPQFSFGILITLIAITCWAFGSVYTAKNKLKINVLYGVGWQMFLSGCVMLPISFFLGQSVNIFSINTAGWLALVYLIIIGSIISFGAYVYTIHHLPPSRASLYAYINPIIAVFLGWLVLDETLNVNVGFGTAVTIVGVYIVNNEFRKQTNTTNQPQSKKEDEPESLTQPAEIIAEIKS